MYNQRPRFNGNRNGNRSRRPAPQLDVSRFVKKAAAVEANPYTARHTFADFGFCEPLNRNIEASGYKEPTPIQDQAILEIAEGKDVVGIAQTGTGKTAAFLLPLINKLYTNPMQKVLIIAPTRELAVQIEKEFWAFSEMMNQYSVLCIGGASMGRQVYALRKNPHFVIGTPGRLKDLERQKVLDMHQFTTVVLDEVDRMLDMGFIKDITYLLSKVPEKRQSLFFSATVPPTVRGIMETFLHDPTVISIRTQDASDHVNQDVVKTNGKPKIEVLHNLLIQEGFSKVLLFGRTKWGIEKLTHELSTRGFKVAAIHGNKRQSQREHALEAFKSNQIQILLATDVASRGIDIPDVTHVINYDLPESHEDYIHRIGRTGRADKFGTALTFID
jgi:ATP-dependent RNA helicase RhlE